jgi:hypothetical protein
MAKSVSLMLLGRSGGGEQKRCNGETENLFHGLFPL